MGRSLSAQYAVLFSRPWPVWGSALLVATVNVFLFAFDRPWTASDRLRDLGEWERGRGWSGGGGAGSRASAGGGPGRQPWLGALLLVLGLAALLASSRAGYVAQGVSLLFGGAFGLIFQPSRFCLVRASREPF